VSTPQSKPESAPTLSERITREREEINRVAEVMREGLRGLYRSQIPRMAAALSYRTIFGLVPVLVIVLVVAGAIIPEQTLEQAISEALEFTGLSEIAIETPGQTPVSDEALAEPTHPAEINKLDQWIADLIARIREVPKATIGFVSALILAYAAISMLVEIERAFNHIYRCVSGRTWWSRITLYWTILTLGTILLGATFFVGQQFHHWVVSAEGDGLIAWVRVNILGFLATASISTLLLTIAYTRVPNTRVQLRPALIGALVAAVLWEAGKWGFTQYLSYSTGYARFYGSLALIPLFLLWVYITWMIVLFGLQVAYALQHFSLEDDRSPSAGEGPTIVEPGMILAVGSFLVTCFREGKPARVEDIAQAIGLPASICARMIEALRAEGVIHALADDHDAFCLARPPESIEARSLVAAAERDVGYPPPEHLRQMRIAAAQSLGRKTLADICCPGESS